MFQNEFNADVFDLKCKITDNSNKDDVIIEFNGVEFSDFMQNKGYVGNSILSLGGSYAVATRNLDVAFMVRERKQLAGQSLYVDGVKWVIVDATVIDRRTVGQQFNGKNRYITVFTLA